MCVIAMSNEQMSESDEALPYTVLDQTTWLYYYQGEERDSTTTDRFYKRSLAIMTLVCFLVSLACVFRLLRSWPFDRNMRGLIPGMIESKAPAESNAPYHLSLDDHHEASASVVCDPCDGDHCRHSVFLLRK